MLKNIKVVRMIEAQALWWDSPESGLQMFKGRIWKVLECHDNTLIFMFSNYYSKVRKLEKALESLQFSSFS